MRDSDVRFFSRKELNRPAFEGGSSVSWWPLMSSRLLILLDVFRFQWGAPVRISLAPGAIGRYLPLDNDSQHNMDRWGEVRAVDVLPEGILTAADMERALTLAKSLAFTGIGIYPDWAPSPGLHLDTRVDREPGDPALWGGIIDGKGRQEFCSVKKALQRMREVERQGGRHCVESNRQGKAL